MANKLTSTPLKKGKAQFMLIGEAKINDYTFKIDNEYDSGWVDNQLNLGVDCGNGNVVYCEMRGGYSSVNDSVLYVHGTKENDNGKKTDDYDNRFTIDWDDRFDESIIETVGENCFVTVGIEKDENGKTFSKKFLSAYDAVEYVQEHLTDGTVINVKGNLTYSGTDKTYIKKEITSIFLSKVEDVADYKATFTQTILLDSSSIGKADKEKNTIGISAYVVDYVGKIKIEGSKHKIGKSVVFPFNFEIAINDEKPEMTSKMLQKFFRVVKKTDIYELTVEGNIVEGQAIVCISEDDIPDDIKELMELGLYTEEEAKEKCAVGNKNREKRMVITRPFITYVTNSDDERKPVVALNTTKYKESDKVFLTQLIAEIETENPKSTNNNSNNNDEVSESVNIDEDDIASFFDSL